MKKTNVHSKTRDELLALLKENQEQLRRLNFDLMLGKVQDTSALKRVKKEIARVLTVLESTHGTNA